MHLDRSKPFAQTYGPDFAAGLAYFQDGLYFKANGEINENYAPNVEVLKSRAPKVQRQPIAQPAAVTDTPKDDLESKSVAQIFQMAQKVVDIMQEAGEAIDYAPTPGNKAANIAFIRAHTE